MSQPPRQSSPSLRLRSLGAEGTDLVDTELPSLATHAVTVHLRCLPGASSIHLALFDGETGILRAEIPADGGELVPLHLARVDGEPSIDCPGRPILRLPPDVTHAPTSPVEIPAADAPLDLALVIDATARLGDAVPGLLLADAEAWAAEVDRLLELVGRLVSHRSGARMSVLAFGDETPSQARSAELLPRYVLHPSPEERGFTPFDLAELRARLLNLPPTPGADFIDALADALAATSSLRWRAEARKVVLVWGESPGHSILHPPPPGADVQVRERDVDHEALRLFERGVEIATIYREAEREGIGEIAWKQRLVKLARSQYRRLASRPENAFEAARLEAARGAQSLERTDVLGREAAWGRLEAVGEIAPGGEV